MLEMFFKTLKWNKELTNMAHNLPCREKLVAGQTGCVQITKVKCDYEK